MPWALAGMCDRSPAGCLALGGAAAGDGADLGGGGGVAVDWAVGGGPKDDGGGATGGWFVSVAAGAYGDGADWPGPVGGAA